MVRLLGLQRDMENNSYPYWLTPEAIRDPAVLGGLRLHPGAAFTTLMFTLGYADWKVIFNRLLCSPKPVALRHCITAFWHFHRQMESAIVRPVVGGTEMPVWRHLEGSGTHAAGTK